jgi:heptose-I-phosphate ethanolaminephosphotransferase
MDTGECSWHINIMKFKPIAHKIVMKFNPAAGREPASARASQLGSEGSSECWMVQGAGASDSWWGFRPAAAARWLWRWRWLVLMNIYLVSPVLLYEGRLHDKTVLFTLPASILGLLAVQLLGARRLWITHVYLLPFYFIAGIDLFTIVNYQTRFATGMIALVVGNLEDARAFLEADFTRTVGSIMLMLTAYLLCLVKICRLRVTVPGSFALLPVLSIVAIYVAVYHYFGSWSLVAMNDRSSPFGIFSQSYLTFRTMQEESRLRELAKSFDFSASRLVTPAAPETYVLVVGESARRHNFGLYGYGRDTTPLLAQTANLLAFQNVVTQVAQTQLSVPLIITRGSIENQLRAAREKSIITLFRDVGFRTYWLSSQQREIAMAAISHYTDEADVVRFFERQHDTVLINAMRDIFAREGDRVQKRFCILHMLGSHFNLTSRYPREFARYPDGLGSGMFSGTSASVSNTELINAYDNTILYTDYVLSQLIALLREQPGLKTFLYVSDHGDNLRDDERNLFGHAHNNEYDLPIPLLFWYSDEYAQQFPGKIAAARLNLAHPLTTRSIFYSLTQMAAITLDDPDLSQLSVFSTQLHHPRRMVGQPTPFDFDEWLARNEMSVPPGKVPQ